MPAGHESQTGWPPPPLGAVPPFQKILNEVDPHQELSEAQRYKLAKSAWNEHLSRMRFTVMRKRSKAKVELASMGARPPKTVKATPRRDRQHRQHLKERLQRTWGPLIISPTPTPPSRRREAPGQPNDPGGGAPGRWH